MASVNKWIGIGNLGKDPAVKTLPSGDEVATFSMACSETWKDKSGEKQEKTEWIQVSFFGKTASVCAQYLRRGSQVYVEGRIETRKYTDKDGIERYITEIKGDRMVMLGGRQGEPNGKPQRQSDDNGFPAGAGDLGDDVPF